jgi:hypothetical protein
MTRCELVTVLGEFHLHETYFFSLSLIMVLHNKKCLRDSLLNVEETPTETDLSVSPIVFSCIV